MLYWLPGAYTLDIKLSEVHYTFYVKLCVFNRKSKIEICINPWELDGNLRFQIKWIFQVSSSVNRCYMVQLQNQALPLVSMRESA